MGTKTAVIECEMLGTEFVLQSVAEHCRYIRMARPVRAKFSRRQQLPAVNRLMEMDQESMGLTIEQIKLFVVPHKTLSRGRADLLAHLGSLFEVNEKEFEDCVFIKPSTQWFYLSHEYNPVCRLPSRPDTVWVG